MRSESRGNLTYSAAFTLVPTNECFNRCTYCNFRRDRPQAHWLSLADAAQQLQDLQGTGVCEILILGGEVHPQSARRQAWFQHIYDLCALVLEYGFLPHTNVGPLSFDEMQQLAHVNVSMGLMLEQFAVELMQTVHSQAPSKVPRLRLQQLDQAGQLQIPFTTGLLFGIGESSEVWQLGLEAIAQSYHRWGHIQEVILQPYQPGSWEDAPQLGFELNRLAEVVALAREILPDAIALQVPPNLIFQPQILRQCLDYGVTDLGGLVPHDYVNPDYDHLNFLTLRTQLFDWGYHLHARLPIYPQYYSHAPDTLQGVIEPWVSGQKVLGYGELLEIS